MPPLYPLSASGRPTVRSDRNPMPLAAAPAMSRPIDVSAARWKASTEASFAAAASSAGTPAFGGLSGTIAARTAGSAGSRPGTRDASDE